MVDPTGAHALESFLHRALKLGPVFVTGASPAVIASLSSAIPEALMDRVRFVEAFAEAAGLARAA